MRLFVSIELEATVRADLVVAVAPLRESAPSVRWTPESQLHLTLRFLGEQPDDLVAPLSRALGVVARDHAAFALELRGLGAFPDRRRPRVLWVGVAAEPRLELLYHDVELACESLGVPVDGRPLRPHVTLGRADRIDPAELAPLDGAARQARVSLTSQVTSMNLMRSELSDRGARHLRVAAAPLGEG